MLALASLAPAVSALAPQGHPTYVRPVKIEGTKKLWQFMTFTFTTSVDTDELLHPAGRNPFLDYRLKVRFVHRASGDERVVNGFYAADGEAADTSATSGNMWRARFTPERVGRWDWSVEFRRGPAIALDPGKTGSAADPRVDGAFGWVVVQPADPAAPGFLSKGRLDYVGEHYCRFAETGEYFIKAGAGGPENFLAYYQFDGTIGDPGTLCLPGDRLHHYDAHAADFTGDAVDMAHLWAGSKGRNILGAINYLASVGVNSQYFITNTHLADGKDVWPWVSRNDKLHFDVSKMEQWERLFSHMSHRGIQLQFVFEEHENDQIPVAYGGVGDGLTPERKLYYREMIARFSHHQAVHWVTGDESDYFDDIATMTALVAEMRRLDPYDHPIAFHSKHPCFGGGCPEPYPAIVTMFSPYFDSSVFDSSVFQTAPGGYNTSTRQLVSGQTNTRKWAHYGDEQSLNATPSNLTTNRTKALWGNLMGGGAGVAWYTGNAALSQYGPGEDMCDFFDLTLEDFGVMEDYFLQGGYAAGFFQSYLPFTEMRPGNVLASVDGSSDYIYYRPEDVGQDIKAIYAVYRGTGSATNLTIGAGTHSVEWYNPRTGAGPFSSAVIVGPGAVSLPLPAEDPGQDWLAIIVQQ